MAINRESFLQKVEKDFFKGNISSQQSSSLNAVLDEWEKRGYTDLRWLAYMLATTYHETAGTMMPIEEYGKGKGRDYEKRLKMNREPYETPNKFYYGRGFVQLTWYENYANMGKHLGCNLLDEPELALELPIATQILFEGMTRGSFTGKPLDRYFNKEREDWISARKIINGLDKAEKIAGHALKFAEALGINATPATSTKPIAPNIKTVKECDFLQMRTGPGRSFAEVERLQPGSQVKVGEEKDGWCRVNDKGWVNKNFLV